MRSMCTCIVRNTGIGRVWKKWMRFISCPTVCTCYRSFYSEHLFFAVYNSPHLHVHVHGRAVYKRLCHVRVHTKYYKEDCSTYTVGVALFFSSWFLRTRSISEALTYAGLKIIKQSHKQSHTHYSERSMRSISLF